MKLNDVDYSPMPKNMSLKSRNIPIICLLPGCFRIMQKQCFRKHCTTFHNFSAEDELPECTVNTNLLSFL